MKSIVILYECDSEYATEKSFDKFSAKQLCISKISKIASENNSKVIRIKKCDNVYNLLCVLNKACKENEADYVIFSYDDLPFLDYSLTEKLIKSHELYKAEYTYADGYPYGFAPEIIDSGTVEILMTLAGTTKNDEGKKAVTRESVFNILKTEINSFEVEAVLAEDDWRLLRLAFHCGTKDNYISCVELYKQVKNRENISADEMSKIASVTPSLLKTVPGFYDIQVSDFSAYDAIYTPYNKQYEARTNINPVNIDCTDNKHCMSYEAFSGLIDNISEFSDTAVVSLSAWGEAFANKNIISMIKKVLSYEGLSVYIETDGYNIDDEMCSRLSEAVSSAKPRTNGWDKIMVAVSLDAASGSKYREIHKHCKDDGFEKAVNAVNRLSKVIPGCVYPMFVRMNDNENELEGFFRYWNDKSNCSNGKFIIQKYNNFAGDLPDRKVADLSPIVRNPCWHLRRDLTILSNGDVPLCKNYVFSNIAGNVFNQSLEDVWCRLNNALIEQINKTYNNKCGKCDEYYTFNF